MFSSSPRANEAKRIPGQSSAAGAVALPSSLKSPPAVSSRHEVKMIGASALPGALSVPLYV